VFILGAANVGKSAFVRAMLREMSQFEGANFDAAAMSSGKYLPVESAMPGTTLGLIPLQAFESGGTLYDTPGAQGLLLRLLVLRWERRPARGPPRRRAGLEADSSACPAPWTLPQACTCTTACRTCSSPRRSGCCCRASA
jgi:nitric-oxide synthase